MALRHRITINVTDPRGKTGTVLKGADVRLPARLVRFLFGDFTQEGRKETVGTFGRSYESLKAAENISELYRRFHILRNDRLIINSSVIEPEDYTVFAENERIFLQKVS